MPEMENASGESPSIYKENKKSPSKRVKTVAFAVIAIILILLLLSTISADLSLNLSINQRDKEGEQALPETGEGEWVMKSGDTMTGDLIMLNANFDLGGNTIVTAATEIESEELDILDEGIDISETSGELGDDQIAAGAIDLDSNEVEGILPINKGGTNASSFDSSEFIWYDGTSLSGSGYDNTSFITSGTDNWVNTSGDTMSGNLTIASGNDLILDNSGDLLLGTTYLNETTSATDSGAYIVGVFDEFSNSNSTNVQAVLDDLDQAIAIGGILPDSLDYTEFEDALDLDASTSLTLGTYNYTLNLNNTGDFTIQDNSTTHWEFRDDGNLYASSDAILNMGGNRVENLGNPNSGDDAVNRDFANTSYINDGAGEIDNSNDFNFATPTHITNLDADQLDGVDSTSFLRSDDDDTYSAGNTLTFDGSSDFNGDVTISDQTIALDDATFSALDLTGDLRILSTGDDDDYIYINTTGDVAGVFWEGTGASTDPGIYTSGTVLGYRDETDSWISFDDLAGGASLWTDLGTELTPAGDESIQLDDGDWIGVGSGANQPYLTFDDSNDYFEFMGGNVGIGTTAPGTLLDVLGGSIRTNNQLISTVTTSTPPLAISSSTLVANLNSDLLDNQEGSYYTNATNIDAGTLGTGYYSAYSDLTAEGYLDNDAGTDLLTRNQSDSRYLIFTTFDAPAGTDPVADSYNDTLTLANGSNISITGNETSDTITIAVDSTGLDADTLDTINSASFLRSDDDDIYSGGNTLTFAGSTDFNGDVTISDQTIAFDDATFSAFDLTGDLRVLATADDDNYIYFNTNTNAAALHWEGYTANDPGFRVNTSTNELEYRDEDEPGWTSLDDLAGGASLWTDLGTELTPAGDESIQLDDGDWIGVGSGANQPYLTFDDTNNFFEFMGGNVGIGTTGPNAKLQVYSATTDTDGIAQITQDVATNNPTLIVKQTTAGGNSYAKQGLVVDVAGTGNGTGIAFDVIGQGTDRFVVLNGGNVGIGTTSPQKKLHIETGDTLNQFILNSQASNADANSVLESLGRYHMSFGVSVTTHYMYYTDSSNVARSITHVGSALDLAEWYKVGQQNLDTSGNSTLLKGNVLCADPNEKSKVITCSKPYSNSTIGIVSTMSFTTMGMNDLDDDHHDAAELALVGQVPTMVSSMNGNIKVNDTITSSFLPGIGMKANKAGSTVGKALESTGHWNEANCPAVPSVDSIVWPNDDGTNPQKPCFRLPDGTYVGKTMVFVNVSWYEPESYLDKLDQIISDYDSGLLNSTAGSIDTLSNLTITNTLTANSIQAQDGTFANIQVGNISVSGNLDVTGLLTSNQIKTGMLQTFDTENLIIQLSEDLGETALEIQNSLEETVFSVDSQGKISIRSDVEGASVGSGEFGIGETEVQIETTAVTGDSKVFVTPRSDVGNTPLYVEDVEEGKFIVKMNEPKDYEVKFDWWVIN